MKRLTNCVQANLKNRTPTIFEGNQRAEEAVTILVRFLMMSTNDHLHSDLFTMSNPTAIVQKLWNHCNILRDNRKSGVAPYLSHLLG